MEMPFKKDGLQTEKIFFTEFLGVRRFLFTGILDNKI